MPDHGPSTQELLLQNDEFRRLYEEHQESEARLEELVHRGIPSQEDEMTMKKLKLHKLALKDRMEALRRHHA